MNSEPLPLGDIQAMNEALAEKIAYLCERSLQLQEYSRFLKERSREINRRIQSCLNSKQSS